MPKKLISLSKEQIYYIEKRMKKFGITNFTAYIQNMIMIEMMEQESLENHMKMEDLLKKGVPVKDAMKKVFK